MTDKIDLAGLVKKLEFTESTNGSLYASFPVGQGFEAFYTIWPQGAFDMWEAEFGILCHEFGGATIWKGTGKENAVKAAREHHAARILAALNLAPVEALVGAAQDHLSALSAYFKGMGSEVNGGNLALASLAAEERLKDAIAAVKGDGK